MDNNEIVMMIKKNDEYRKQFENLFLNYHKTTNSDVPSSDCNMTHFINKDRKPLKDFLLELELSKYDIYVDYLCNYYINPDTTNKDLYLTITTLKKESQYE